MPGDRSATRVDGPAERLAVEQGWELLELFRVEAERARTMSFPYGFDPELDISWQPLGIGHGDLGMALVYSAADQLDPDGGWDHSAMDHVRAAAESFPDTPMAGVGLFSGTSALAFCLRALSREGERYARAIVDVEAMLATRLRRELQRVDPHAGVSTDFYDVIVGLCGAVTYVMTTAARETELGESAVQAIGTLAALSLVDFPGGLWTPPEKVGELEGRLRPELWAGYLNCGFAHGIAGALNLLGQACDRGIGGDVVAEATDRLADLLVEVSTTRSGLDVPANVPLQRFREGEGESGTARTRYAWCYGNLGAALPFHNSRHLAARHPDVLTRLLDTSGRTADDMGLDNPTLCHGTAGKLVLERAMLGADTVPDNVAGLLAQRNPERVFGFDNIQSSCPTLDSPGLLDGSGGAAVALVSLAAPPDALHAVRMFTGRWPS